jgi:hypothetical protein
MLIHCNETCVLLFAATVHDMANGGYGVQFGLGKIFGP